MNAGAFIAAGAVLLTAFAGSVSAAPARAETVLHHVHGLAYTPDGKSLMVPAHTGLAVYREGRWRRAPGPAHDFMGFSVAQNAIYTSGHPAPGSPLTNPLGLMKSADGGATWQPLGLSGESDFHLMAAGYRSQAVYVMNGAPNSRMQQPGIYFTRDDGKAWQRAAAVGLPERVTSIAVHPTASAKVAVGTVEGLYLSEDSGARFKRLGEALPVTAAAYDHDGNHVYYTPAEGAVLHHTALEGAVRKTLPLPRLGRDFVVYIAQNPVKRSELAIATRERHVFISADGGKAWKQIARNGEAL